MASWRGAEGRGAPAKMEAEKGAQEERTKKRKTDKTDSFKERKKEKRRESARKEGGGQDGVEEDGGRGGEDKSDKNSPRPRTLKIQFRQARVGLQCHAERRRSRFMDVTLCPTPGERGRGSV